MCCLHSIASPSIEGAKKQFGEPIEKERCPHWVKKWGDDESVTREWEELREKLPPDWIKQIPVTVDYVMVVYDNENEELVTSIFCICQHIVIG